MPEWGDAKREKELISSAQRKWKVGGGGVLGARDACRRPKEKEKERHVPSKKRKKKRFHYLFFCSFYWIFCGSFSRLKISRFHRYDSRNCPRRVLVYVCLCVPVGGTRTVLWVSRGCEWERNGVGPWEAIRPRRLAPTNQHGGEAGGVASSPTQTHAFPSLSLFSLE